MNCKCVEIAGKEYQVKEHVKDSRGRDIPLLNLPMMSDYKWQLGCLKSRLKNPEIYRATGEDVEAVIEQLRQWLAEHEEE